MLATRHNGTTKPSSSDQHQLHAFGGDPPYRHSGLKMLHTPTKPTQPQWQQDVVPGGPQGALESISWAVGLRYSSERCDSHRAPRVKLASSDEPRGASHLLSEHVTPKGVPCLARCHARATREEPWASSRDIFPSDETIRHASLHLETYRLGLAWQSASPV